MLTGCAASSSESFFRQAPIESRTVAGPAAAVADCTYRRLSTTFTNGLERTDDAGQPSVVLRAAGGTLLWTLTFRPVGDRGTEASLTGFQTWSGTDRTAAPRLFPNVEACAAGRSKASPARPEERSTRARRA